MIAKPQPNLEEIQKAVRVVIGHGRGRVVEVRAFNTPQGTWCGYYDKGTLSQDVFDLSSREEVPNIYWTIQDIDPVLLNGVKRNAIFAGATVTTNDTQIKRYVWLPIDCDPDRPTKTSSTEAEKAAALTVAESVRDFLSSEGVDSVLADSGNGNHVLVPLDIPNVNGTNKLVEKVLNALNGRFGTNAVKIDTGVFNPSRILKIYGSVARKGQHTDERPWRTSKLVDVPATLSTLNEDHLKELLVLLTSTLPSEKIAEIAESKVYTPPNPGTQITGERNNAVRDYAWFIWSNQPSVEPDVADLKAKVYQFNQEFCVPPLDESELDQTILASTPKKRRAIDNRQILVGGKIAGSAETIPAAQAPSSDRLIITPQEAAAIVADAKRKEDEENERILADLNIVSESYPVFPRWTLLDTSIYTGLVKPIVDANPCRIPEFLFLPAVVLFLNFLGTKVRVEMKDLSLSFYLAMIGKRGQTKKSSSVKDAVNYFKSVGYVAHGDMSDNNANGRALIFTAGSPEGFGKELNRLNCKNGVLLYDELVQLTNKAGIDGSALSSALLSLYDNNKYQNLVTSSKNHFSLLPGQYCASLITCSTERNFEVNWSRLSAASSGLDDRFYFAMAPETLQEPSVFTYVDTAAGAARTRELIDAAVRQGTYRIDDQTMLSRFLREHKNQDRSEIRAEKLALYFAIDLGRDSIDADCIERAIALSEYELAVKKFLPNFESYNKQAALQQRMMHELNRHGGKETERMFRDNLNVHRYGTYEWDNAFKGLLKSGWLKQSGTGVKSDPKMLIQLQTMPREED